MSLVFWAAAMAWRASSVPPGALWRDWGLLLGGYAIGAMFFGKTRTWPLLTASFMAYLLALYTQGQLGHTLRLLGWIP